MTCKNDEMTLDQHSDEDRASDHMTYMECDLAVVSNMFDDAQDDQHPDELLLLLLLPLLLLLLRLPLLPQLLQLLLLLLLLLVLLVCALRSEQ